MTGARRIVVVGGGFSGAAVALHLLRRGGDDLRVDVVEVGPALGRGIAYGFESDVFRLNVPASKMSIDPAVPDDFVRFAGAGAEPDAFLSRALYGRYVERRLAEARRASRGELHVWQDEAIAASESEVVLRSGPSVPADAVVLATGLTPRLPREGAHPGVVDAWDEAALQALPRTGRILLLGSGLSALDVLALLEAKGFEGNVTLVSRHALLPGPHEEPFRAVAPMTPGEVAAAPRELLALVRWTREATRETTDRTWQQAVDRLRPHVAALYRGLSDRDRARFVRHVRPYWDVARHRAPHDALARASALGSAGRLRRIAGRVEIVHASGPEVEVTILERTGARRVECFAAVIRCIGPALDVADGGTPLMRSLLERGLARITPGGLGIETLASGSVVSARGVASSRLFGIGAVRRASHWETTSVPDIARDASKLAEVLIPLEQHGA